MKKLPKISVIHEYADISKSATGREREQESAVSTVLRGAQDKPDAREGCSFGLAEALGLMSQISISIVFCLFIGIYLGRFLDARLGTTPWLLMAGVFLGVAAAFKMLYDVVIKKWMG